MADGSSIIAELATSLGLDLLEPDEAGLYTLLIDGGLPVFLRLTPERDGVVLFAGLGTLAADRAGAASRALLEANHFWTETGGFTLCLVPGTLNLMLVGRERTEALAQEGLFPLFDRFVSAATVWRHRLPTIADNAPTAAVGQMMDAADAAEADTAPSMMPFPGTFA
jgi:hypothetical protein